MNIHDVMNIVPESYKEAVRAHQYHKIAMVTHGFNTCSLPEILEHIGTKLASRKSAWKSVSSGLEALNSLKNDA